MAKTLKDFLNERQLGPMVVKNPDEQKFIDKHVVAKTADRNGNDDELFKGSKVKMADRPKHRKGYNPGEDEEVYEALKGTQHKIDANKNGKVDAHDFHLLRKKKKVAEEAEELDELSTDTLRNYRAKAKDDAYDAADVDDDRRLRKRSMGSWDAGKKILKRGDALRKEEAEELEELSKKTLDSYTSKASGDLGFTHGIAKNHRYAQDQGGAGRKPEHKAMDNNRLRKRASGLVNSLKRLAKEEAEQIDEISAEKKDAYAQKAGKQLSGLFAKSNTADGARKYYNRKNAVRKIANEEAEQIDEILDTPKKAADYKAKAEKSFKDNIWKGGEKAVRTTTKRLYGLSHPKVAEEAEQVNEKDAPHVKDYGPYGGRASSAKEKMIADFNKPKNKNEKPNRYTKESRVLAIASKLATQYGSAPLNKEERLLTKLADLAETHQRTMISVFEKLNEDNQHAFMQACDTADGIEQMLDFSISYRGE